jgi:hypothetical protein
MKKLLLIFTMALFLLPGKGQEKMNEKQAIKETHIDFTKQYIFFTLHGLIEIDGHIFKNDTCKCPIIYKSTLDGITIIDTCKKIEYVHRKCSKKGCNIIHFIKKEDDVIQYSDPPYWVQPLDRVPILEHLDL